MSKIIIQPASPRRDWNLQFVSDGLWVFLSFFLFISTASITSGLSSTSSFSSLLEFRYDLDIDLVRGS